MNRVLMWYLIAFERRYFCIKGKNLTQPWNFLPSTKSNDKIIVINYLAYMLRVWPVSESQLPIPKYWSGIWGKIPKLVRTTYSEVIDSLMRNLVFNPIQSGIISRAVLFFHEIWQVCHTTQFVQVWISQIFRFWK